MLRNRSDATLLWEVAGVVPTGSATEFLIRVAMLRVPSLDSPAPPSGLSLRAPASPASKTPPTPQRLSMSRGTLAGSATFLNQGRPSLTMTAPVYLPFTGGLTTRAPGAGFEVAVLGYGI